MKLKSFLVMLLCMVLFTAAVTAAEETAVIAVEDTADGNANVTEESETVVVILFTPEASNALSAIEHTLMMSTEEAFDYLLTGDAEEKQVFLDELATLENETATFEENYDLTAGEAAEVKVLYDEVLAAADGMETTADIMFASYEAGQTNPEEVAAFEEQVDTVSEKINAIWSLTNGSTTEPLSVDSYRQWLIGQLLDAAEETYAYPVTGNVTEKEDALASYAKFDTVLADAQEQYPDESFEELKTVKVDLLTAAETMFATYEANGAVNTDEVSPFETALESFTDTYVIVVPVEVVNEEVIVVKEPVTEE